MKKFLFTGYFYEVIGVRSAQQSGKVIQGFISQPSSKREIALVTQRFTTRFRKIVDLLSEN